MRPRLLTHEDASLPLSIGAFCLLALFPRSSDAFRFCDVVSKIEVGFSKVSQPVVQSNAYADGIDEFVLPNGYVAGVRGPLASSTAFVASYDTTDEDTSVGFPAEHDLYVFTAPTLASCKLLDAGAGKVQVGVGVLHHDTESLGACSGPSCKARVRGQLVVTVANSSLSTGFVVVHVVSYHGGFSEDWSCIQLPTTISPGGACNG